MGQIHYLAHPRSRALLPIVQGVYGIVKHLGQDQFKWMNSMGETVARKSALKVVEKLIEGPNQQVLSWSKEQEAIFERHPDSHMRRKAIALLVPSFTYVGDNLQWVMHVDSFVKSHLLFSSPVIAIMTTPGLAQPLSRLRSHETGL